jgi:hypothetical protein
MKKKRRVVLSRKEAVQRLDEMILLIEENVRIGLRIEAALETANGIVMSRIDNMSCYGAECYNIVKDCMALNLALTLARLFDSGARRIRPNKRDVASIPLLIRLLRQKRCHDALIARARSWTPHLPESSDAQAACCERAIKDAIGAYVSLRRTHQGRQAAETLKQFRDKKLAHSLMGTVLKAVPQYRQLFLLMDVARDVTNGAKLAIRGDNLDFKEVEDGWHCESRAFWEPALRAAVTAAEADFAA